MAEVGANVLPSFRISTHRVVLMITKLGLVRGPDAELVLQPISLNRKYGNYLVIISNLLSLACAFDIVPSIDG